MDPWQLAVIVVAVPTSFLVSASAGLGGSLLLVPVLAITLGTREGIALAALLLGANNVVKTVAYRHSLPLGSALPLVVMISIGALAGARLLGGVPDDYVAAAVLAALALAFLAERLAATTVLPVGSSLLAVAAGMTSGFSGTSGPLKGLAIRGLGLDRRHTVGAASLTSLAGDISKAAVFAGAGLIGPSAVLLTVALFPVMIVATGCGRHLNGLVGERGYAGLFWMVMAGYATRILAT
jgi:uncharacterized protein